MKKISLIFCTVVISFLANAQKPGSGNAIQLTGTGSITTSPYINIGSGFDFGAELFTYETWIKRDAISTQTQNNYGKILIVGDDNYSWGVGIFNDNTLYFTKVNANAVASTGKLEDTKWHHVAVVYTGTQIQFYIDGVAAGNPAYTSTFDNTSGIYIIGPRQSFGNSNGDQTLDGQLDETRIWKNVALTQTEIKDWMCRKITSAHPEYAKLFAYYQFDEGSGTITSGGGHDGTLVNEPMWKISGASLGDASAYHYAKTTKTVTLASSTGEKFTATSTSGDPDGIQVYLVNEQPNSLTGTTGVGGNDKYFGVFQIGGTTPQYTAVYNYGGNPFVNASEESNLRLFSRADNSVPDWAVISSMPDQTANTITVAGQSTEYILGSTGYPLSVILTDFLALKQNSSVILNWSTENEINFSHFEVERSANDNNFSSIGEVAAHNINSLRKYTLEDKNPLKGINLYRLKLVDRDGNVMYSKVVSVIYNGNGTVTIYPNPAKDYIQVEGVKEGTSIEIIGASGKLIKRFIANASNKYMVSDLRKGLYFIKIHDEEKSTVTKLIIE